MPNIYGLLNTAATSMATHQIALEVTGQNISNVNNPNYTRQEVTLESAFPIQPGGTPGMIGTGVRATSIIRRNDQFLESQRLLNQSNSGYWNSTQDFMARLETVFNESSPNGLNGQMDSYYKSWQNLASNPQGLTERTDTIAQGRNISATFSKVNQDVKNLRVDLNTKINSSIPDINRITGEIATYNQVIHETESHNVSANDFRDKRDSLIRDLATYAQVNTVEDPNTKEVTVSLANGRALVIGQTAFKLEAKQRADDGLSSDIMWIDPSGQRTDVTAEFGNGNMGAWLNMRDTQMPGYLDKLDQLAATMIRDTNITHSAGYGLDGSTGQDFFTGININTVANRKNTGTGTVAGVIVAPDKLNVHKYQMEFTAANSYNIRDMTNNAIVATEPYAAGPATSAYLLTQGMQVTINGAPAANDKFIVNPAADASYTMAVHTNIFNDSNKVAAGLTTSQGDGENALRIAQSQSGMTMNRTSLAASGTATFSQYYNSLVGQAGVEAKNANAAVNQQEAINTQTENRQQQVGGVALDEEMVNLIKFQHAYQASARLVSVVDSMLQELIGLAK